MKNTLPLLAFLVCFQLSPASAADIKTYSKIDKVTVYTNRATVTRLAKVTLPKGSHVIVMDGLPASLIGNSLRAKGTAQGQVKIGALSHKSIAAEKISSERESKIQQYLTTINDKIDVHNDEIKSLEKQMDFINGLSHQAQSRTAEEISILSLKPQEWENAASYIHSKTSEILKNTRVLRLKIRELNEEKSRLQHERNQVRTTPKSNGNFPWDSKQRHTGVPPQSSITVKIPVEVDKETTLDLSLEYQVPGATWRPLYDAHLSTEKRGNLEITQFGSVKQNTGEDWTGASLTLSTAQPQRGTSLPNLNTLWVDARKPVPQKKRNNLNTAAQEEYKVTIDPLQEWRKNAKAQRFQADFAESPPQPVTFQGAQIETGGFVSEYKILGKHDIIADGTFTKLLIGNFETNTHVKIHIKPQSSDKAYLVAQSKLKGENPILPGAVNLFRDNIFVGKTAFPMLRPDEEHALYFGIDDQVSVKRKTLKNYKSEDGLIVKDSVLQKAYVTEIKNLHTFPVDIILREAVPVSKNENVEISIQKKTTTAGYKTDVKNTKGLLSWAFKLPAKSNKDIHLDWKITWPSDHLLSGI